MSPETTIVPINEIEQSIFLIRGQKVILDAILAQFYQVKTKELNKAAKRNPERFPEDFVFQLTSDEIESLRFQFGTSNVPFGRLKGRGGRRYLPYVFTEQGVAMLSSVLKSKRAVLVNVEIMRTFIRLRRFIDANKALAKKMEELEKKVGSHDKAIKSLFEAIHEMMNPPAESRKKIGFKVNS